jgi:hypothetical protein
MPSFYDLWSRSAAAGIEQVEKVSGLCCLGQRGPDSFPGHIAMRNFAAPRKTGRVNYSMTVLVFQFRIRRLHEPWSVSLTLRVVPYFSSSRRKTRVSLPPVPFVGQLGDLSRVCIAPRSGGDKEPGGSQVSSCVKVHFNWVTYSRSCCAIGRRDTSHERSRTLAAGMRGYHVWHERW